MADPSPRFHWTVPAPHPLDEATIEAARARGLSARALRVLSRRGPIDEAGLAVRFDPPERSLHDPELLPDAAAVRARVARARRDGERVMVLGDFDADGLTGLAILTLALRRLGLDVAPYVPSRTDEGHGLSARAVEAACAAGQTLILKADTGSSSVAEVAAAAAAGVDVLITDHHALPPAWPRAAAIVNPHRPDSRYPDRRLSGAGVAFKVAQLLLADEPDGAGFALDLADLAAIGSVADVVPMVGENRAILRLGLERIASRPRPGVAALVAASRAARGPLDAEAIGFGIAPRLNAMGRVGDPAVAAALLLAPDAATAAPLVDRLEAANDLRRELTAAALSEARALAAEDGTRGPGVAVIVGDWPVGIIGLVAGRLADELGRPTVVVSRVVSPWRASARSAGGFDLAAAFEACADLLERHGGHPAAAGCHVLEERLPAFRERLATLASRMPPSDPRPSLAIDLVQSASSVDHLLLGELAPLERSGEAPPLVGIAGLSVARARLANGGHTQLTLRKGIDVIDGICFGRTDLAALREGQAVDVVARLSQRSFAGLDALQLEVRDVAEPGSLARSRDAGRAPLVGPVAVAGVAS
jgi:single-stranded-DNA-specific exonuclease